MPGKDLEHLFIGNPAFHKIGLGFDGNVTCRQSDTCDILRVSRAKLYLLINDGSLRPVKIGKKTLFKESELQRFMKSLNGKSRE